MLRAIIVDDEAPARDELEYLINEVGGVEVVAKANNTTEAIKALQEYPCDLLFLDINMPDATGIALARALQSLSNSPCVIFITAYSEYAVDAFEVKAVDYLLKPVEEGRLKKAIQTATSHVQVKNQMTKSKRITCERGGKKIFIYTSDIVYAEAHDDYSYIYTKDDRFFSTMSLLQVEKSVTGGGFYRIHRGFLVNLAFVEEVDTSDSNSIQLALNCLDKKLPVSRRNFQGLKKALNV